MNILAWIIFGVLVGWVGILFYAITGTRARVATMVMALAGALAGGTLVYVIDSSNRSSLDPLCIFAAIALAIIGVMTSRQLEARINH